MLHLAIDIRCKSSPHVDFEDLLAITASCIPALSQLDTEISLSLVEATEMQALNLKYRERDYVTDVLSFPCSEPRTLGDIVICPEQALKQAQELGHSLNREMSFLFVHGLLHLLGYDHEISSEDERLMFDLQDHILSQISF